VSGFHQVAQDNGFDPKLLFECSKKVLEIQNKTGQAADSMPQYLMEMEAKALAIETEIEQVQRERAKAKASLEGDLKGSKATIEDLNLFKSTRTSLEAHGLDLTDVSRFVQMLKNAKEEDFDVSKICERISEIDSLSSEGERLKKQRNELRDEGGILDREINAKKMELEGLDSAIRSMRKSVESVAGTGLEEIRNTAERTKELVDDVFDKLQGAATSFTTDLENNRKVFGSSAENIVKNANQVNMSIGNLNSALDKVEKIRKIAELDSIFRLSAGEKVSRDELLPVFCSLLVAFRTYVERNSLSPVLGELTNGFISGLESAIIS